MSTTPGTVYPRFLGVDDGGDFVWELANGRWTWGEDPHDAATRQRTFTPDRYSEKYGHPQPVAPFSATAPAEAPPFPGPASPEPPAIDVHNPTSTVDKASASLGLYTLLTVLDDWIEGAHENHEALEHRGRENVGEECWRSFAPSDIRNMINDAARELGLGEFPTPERGKEDEYR
jgi:hypothetical protein